MDKDCFELVKNVTANIGHLQTEIRKKIWNLLDKKIIMKLNCMVNFYLGFYKCLYVAGNTSNHYCYLPIKKTGK